MPYCKNCGEEINEGVRFCPKCGNPTRTDIQKDYRRHGRSWTIDRILFVIIGIIILLPSFGLLLGGIGITFANRILADEEGFILTSSADLQVESYAIVGKGVNIEIDPASRLWIDNLGDIVTLKLVASSNDPSKEVFIGIARDVDASGYFRDMWYHEVDEFHWSYEHRFGSPLQVSFTTHPGEPPLVPPIVHSWWAAHSTGSGVQEIEWEPEIGKYWIVVMNADGSSEVDVSIRIGANVPILITIGNILLIIGVIALVIGGALIYEGVIRRSRIKQF